MPNPPWPWDFAWAHVDPEKVRDEIARLEKLAARLADEHRDDRTIDDSGRRPRSLPWNRRSRRV
jgi:hypothetical protein